MFGKLSTSPTELLQHAVDASAYREAEASFVQWMMQADLFDALGSVGSFTDKQARRAGYAVSTAVRAKLLKKSDAEPFLCSLRAKVGATDLPSLRDTWQSDMPFEVTRFKQRWQEQNRRASYAL